MDPAKAKTSQKRSKSFMEHHVITGSSRSTVHMGLSFDESTTRLVTSFDNAVGGKSHVTGPVV
eukprot:5319281-Amphidinium_carterae.1